MTNGITPAHQNEASPAPSAITAAERAIEAAQRIVVERIELIRLETQDALASVLRRIGLVLATAVVAVFGWCGLAVAAALLLAERMSPAAAVATIGAVHLLTAVAIGIYLSSAERT